jgi:hypothetical protein
VFPTPIAGHGARAVAATAADPLELNGLLLIAGGQRCLLLSFDLLYVGGPLEERLRAQLSDRYGLARSELLLFASHTHFAPPTDPTLPGLGPCDAPYADRIVGAVTDLAAELLSRPAVPCRLEIRRGMLAHAVNRRRPRIAPTFTRSRGLAFDRVALGPHAAGPRDDTATLVRLARLDAPEAVAVIWHYACHPVGHVPSNVTTADFPGVARRSLRHVENAEVPVLYLQGFCGNLRPNLLPERSPGVLDALRNLAQSAIGGTAELRTSPANWQAWTESLESTIAGIARKPPDILDLPAQLRSACGSVPLRDFFEGEMAREQLHLWGLALGDKLELYGLGAEPSIEWQAKFAEALGAPAGIRIYSAYCGDVFGYLPVPEQVREGGYEVRDFQRWFGMAGRFRAEGLRTSIVPAVQGLARALGKSTRESQLT